ncbi:transporter substrate-binding domain-containing protein [Enterococcus sp. OL5]|uniref:transporter substrate-binding domain-containing protein n=1 Tax=Enterococcus sp. OL5 TaxID=2590214 RepID=UPI00112DA8DE|nr:transporter substrate-binding domain-containing protein [Enterococcus sp. OL5]TPR55123.1 transporter substrate-binding domain-containing protein [Enterococcus sp. OL5]
MKRNWLPIAACLLFLSACGTSAKTTETRTADTSEKTLTVTTAGLHFPWNYKEKDNTLTGYDVEVTTAVAEKLGYQIDWVTTDFSSQMAQLEAGRADAVAEHVAITEKRKETYQFSRPYAYPDIELMVTKDSTLKELTDLKGKKVAVALGSFYEDYIRSHNPEGDIEVVTYEDTSGIPNDISYGRVDAYLNDKISGEEKIKQSGLALKMTGVSIFQAEFAYPFPKTEQGTALLKQFDQALEELKADGTLKKLSEKYFSEDLSTKS